MKPYIFDNAAEVETAKRVYAAHAQVRSWQIVLQKSQLDLRYAYAQHTPKMGFLAPAP
jgi:hypothetical protein